MQYLEGTQVLRFCLFGGNDKNGQTLGGKQVSLGGRVKNLAK